MPDLKAYRVTVPDYMPDVRCIHWAETHGKARYQNLLAAWDAGYYSLGFHDVMVRRAPEYDDLSHLREEGAAFGEGYIKSQLEESHV